MSSLYSDTHPKMEELQIQLWQQASPTCRKKMLARKGSSDASHAEGGIFDAPQS
jgi:hypothetical protein